MGNNSSNNQAYQDFLASKRGQEQLHGFSPNFMPDFLFDFQSHLTDWVIRKGRAALFEDCGLGKTPQQLVWAENVVRKTNKPVLILTPLAVSAQTIREGEKFGIECKRSQTGKVWKGINVTNYERLHYFDAKDFAGVVADESSILKNYDGKMRRYITDFLHQVDYCLLCSATPAPNDYMELGTSSEALGEMNYSRMLGMFFVNDGKTTQKWSLKGHAKKRFWQWMSGWARAIRKPSDLGFDDEKFNLPELKMEQHLIPSLPPKFGFLPLEAKTLNEQRAERKQTLQPRCEKVAEVIPEDESCVVWCHLNMEGDLLEKIIPGAVQVAGKDPMEQKEERLIAFVDGKVRVLVTKPKIAGFGQNWQHCANMTFFPSHSYEQFYQAVRRCWRFGQTRPVTCNIITSERESSVLANMQRKERQVAHMFEGIVREMTEFQTGKKTNGEPTEEMEIPAWL